MTEEAERLIIGLETIAAQWRRASEGVADDEMMLRVTFPVNGTGGLLRRWADHLDKCAAWIKEFD